MAKHTCVHCREDIIRDRANAACGWRHKKSKQVICRLTDATPMDKVSQHIWNDMSKPTQLLKLFPGKWKEAHD